MGRPLKKKKKFKIKKGQLFTEGQIRMAGKAGEINKHDVEHIISVLKESRGFFMCQKKVEMKSRCFIQCEACKEYFSPLNMHSDKLIKK